MEKQNGGLGFGNKLQLKQKHQNEEEKNANRKTQNDQQTAHKLRNRMYSVSPTICLIECRIHLHT